MHRWIASTFTQRIISWVVLSVYFLIAFTPSASAITNDQRKVLREGIHYYNTEQDCGSSAQPSAANGGSVIALDPGHSPKTDPNGTDPTTGLITYDYDNHPEMENAYTAATKIKSLLEADGYTVFMTKNSANEKLNLAERANRANGSGAQLLVTLHSNQGGDNMLMYPDGNSKRPWSGTRKDGSNTLLHPDIAQPSQAAASTMAPIINDGIASLHPREAYTAKSFYGFYGQTGLVGNGSNPGNTPVQTILSSIPEVYSEVDENILPTDAFAQAMAKAIKAAVPLGSGSDSSGSSACCSSGGAYGGAGVDSSQILAFAASSIDSTWGVSDSTAEQWFLQQAGARTAIAKYGLNASNIGNITSAVKAAGVSVVFFYAYAVNEGGGSGGFINHYDHEVAGGGVGNATSDAEYLADQSKIMDSHPSWIDAGNPVDFVPKDVQDAGNAAFQSMPSGTIGRAYIPATAATTWEVYYPNGLKGEYNKVQDYGSPLHDTMQNIQKMGGDPSQGGATSGSCSSGVAGEGITKAINWAKKIAEGDAYGYDQDTRASGWAKWQSDPSCTNQCGNFDCSSFVAAALAEGGFSIDASHPFATFTEGEQLEKAGFTKVASSAPTSANLQPGDILINTANHTAIYIGNNQTVEAWHNENGSYHGGQPGDQDGDEIGIHTFYDYPWDAVYRAPN